MDGGGGVEGVEEGWRGGGGELVGEWGVAPSGAMHLCRERLRTSAYKYTC